MPKPILVVDDAGKSLTELAQALAESGYAPTLVAAGGIAVEHFAAQRPDLVFVSLALAEPLTICEGIRSDPDGAIVPIVLVGRDHPDVRSPADALNQGADFFFELPLDRAKMLAKVQTYIGRGDKTPGVVTVVGAPPPPVEVAPVEPPPPAAAEPPSPLTRSADVLLAAIEAHEAELEAKGAAAAPGGVANDEAREQERRQAHEAARRIAEDTARRDAEQEARRQADDEARREAEAMARRDAEALREAEEAERREAAEASRPDAAALRDAEEAERREAAEIARRDAAALREAEEAERHEAEQAGRRDAEEAERRRAGGAVPPGADTGAASAGAPGPEPAQTTEPARLPAAGHDTVEAARRAEDEAWRRTERELRQHDEDTRQRSEDELRRRIEQEARQKIEDEVRRRIEDETRQKVEGETRKKLEDEARKKLEDETRKRLEDETRKKLEDEARKKVEDEARKKLEDEARKKVEDELRRRAEAESRARLEDETRRRIEDETRQRLEEEARRRNADASREAELRRRVEEEMRREMGLPPLEAPSPAAPPVAAMPSAAPVAPPIPGSMPRPSARPLGAGMVAPAPAEGVFDPVQDVASVLAALWQQQVTGRVDFTSQGRQKTLFFERGLAVDAYSTQTFDRIEEYLLRENRITRAQYQEVRVKGLRGPRRVAAFLATEGYLKPEELFGAVRGHLQENLFGLFEWEDGAWAYVPERSAEPDRVALDSDPRALLLEGIRRKYLLPRMLAKVGGPSSIVTRRGEAGELDALRVTPAEREVARLLDGTRSLEDVVFSTGQDPLTVYHLTCALCALGLAEVIVRGLEGAARAGAGQGDAIDLGRIKDKLEQVRNLDYFTMLGVTRAATPYEIDRAYEHVRADFHPARFSPGLQDTLRDELSEIDQVLAEARDVLRNERLRDAYARHLPG